jgi:hypothetical protein
MSIHVEKHAGSLTDYALSNDNDIVLAIPVLFLILNLTSTQSRRNDYSQGNVHSGSPKFWLLTTMVVVDAIPGVVSGLPGQVKR